MDLRAIPRVLTVYRVENDIVFGDFDGRQHQNLPHAWWIKP